MNNTLMRQKEEAKKMITSNLLLAIGFSVNENGYIIDTDTCTRFEFNGKHIRTTLFGNPITHYGDIELDIFNTRLMMTLLNFVMSRSTSEDGIYYRLYHEEKINDTKTNLQKSRLVIGSSNGNITTDYYFNDSFKYIESMLKISNAEDFIVDLCNHDRHEYKLK